MRKDVKAALDAMIDKVLAYRPEQPKPRPKPKPRKKGTLNKARKKSGSS